jgi:purine-binding chemotaxis protein CheW
VSAPSASETSFILCELAGTTYAVRSQSVRQMEMVENITPVPNAPAFVEGVVFSRGQVVPAINLRRRFGFEPRPHDLKTRLIVISHMERAVGLLVDSAREFVSIPDELLHPPPEALSGMSGKYLQSIARINDRLVLILDLDAVLDFASRFDASTQGP